MRVCTWLNNVSNVVAAASAAMRARLSTTAGAAKTEATKGMRAKMVEDLILALMIRLLLDG